MKQTLLALLCGISFIGFAQTNATEIRFRNLLSQKANALTLQKVRYVPAYVSIPYPNGDVPANTGVCTDVVIRAYRQMGVDLQKEVHEDMASHFALYPTIWGRKTTDKNIDHRRVPNLMKYFSRKGKVLPTTTTAADYSGGEIVCWELSPGVTHIGIVVAQKSRDGRRNLVVHNIGNGQELSDCLFDYKIIGHYYYQVK